MSRTGCQSSSTGWSGSTAGSSSQARNPAAVVMSVEDLESLEETLDIMDSAELRADIRESLAEVAAGEAEILSKDEARRLISGQ